jgi:hypothetical protein
MYTATPSIFAGDETGDYICRHDTIDYLTFAIDIEDMDKIIGMMRAFIF